MRGRAPKPEPSYALMIVIVLLALPLSGCLAGGGDQAEPTTLTEDAQGDDRQTPTPRPVQALSFDGPVLDRTIWANGSFDSQEVLLGETEIVFAGQATQVENMDEAAVDLTDVVPAGLPVSIHAKLTAEPRPGTEVDLFLSAGNVTFHRVDGGQDGQKVWLERGLVRFGEAPLQVVANANWNVTPDGAPAPEVPYTLKIKVDSHPDRVPLDVTTAVDVPDDAQAIELTPVDPEADLAVRAWGPDDLFLGRITADGTGTVQVPVDGSGEHVLMPDATAFVRLVDEGGEPSTPDQALRPLNLQATWGQTRELSPDGGQESWSFETEGVPVTVLLRLDSQDAGLRSAPPAEGPTFEVSSPAGTVFDMDPTCSATGCVPFVLRFGGTFVWVGFGLLGNPNLVSDTYEVQADYETGIMAQVTPGAVHYVR